MESIEDFNCPSINDSFSLYERYMRSFSVVDAVFPIENNQDKVTEALVNHEDDENSNAELDVCGNVVVINPAPSATATNTVDLPSVNHDSEPFKLLSPFVLDGGSLQESSSVTSYSTEKSEHQVSSEDSKPERSKFPKPVVITSLITMENSNNAVDSVRLFCKDPSESVFKLPNSELSFNGAIKHVRNLKPIVAPITAITSTKVDEFNNANHASSNFTHNECFDNSTKQYSVQSGDNIEYNAGDNQSSNEPRTEESVSMGDSQCNESNLRCEKWFSQKSYSSLDTSFDSGVRSPDMFSESEDEAQLEPDKPDRWGYVKEYEAQDKATLSKMEEILQGVLPPPSVTMLKTDVTEMLKKYHCFLPAFTEDANSSVSEANTTTPTKRSSFIHIPTDTKPTDLLQETTDNFGLTYNKSKVISYLKEPVTKSHDSQANISVDNKVPVKMGTETEARKNKWPEVLKCRYYDVYYNVTQYSERIESLALRCGQRYVGAETDTSVSVYSGGLQSPNSANKRKALRLKMASAKSPGRRLSHLARRRQAFCSAATISEKAHASTAKMVLIDKNYFPHRKLINMGDRKSPRVRKTPGKRTPARKTPNKKTPSKTPKTRSGGSSRKKAMRRLLLDPDSMTRSQPTRESSKRALFISPENRKILQPAPSTSAPQAIKSRRALFGSPVRQCESKSLDGTASEQFLKRKRDLLDDSLDGNRSKIAKSYSFGGDSASGSLTQPLSRRASEIVGKKALAEMDEHHRKKLLWAVTEALRGHGWRMSSPGFRDKAGQLARLVRRLLTLPPLATRLAAAPSTSDALLKIARLYVFAIIQGRSIEECFQEERAKHSEDNQKLSGYISALSYQQMRSRQASTSSLNSSQIKENTCDGVKPEQPKSTTKNVLQDKLINIDSNSNSSSLGEKSGFFKSNSMPSFDEAAKMRIRRQISFDNIDFPKR